MLYTYIDRSLEVEESFSLGAFKKFKIVYNFFGVNLTEPEARAVYCYILFHSCFFKQQTNFFCEKQEGVCDLSKNKKTDRDIMPIKPFYSRRRSLGTALQPSSDMEDGKLKSIGRKKECA